MPPLPAKPAMKDRILETADRLFYLQGIRAVGVDTIAAEIGISKRTLYNHFPSKDALIAAYLERRFVAPRPSDKSPVEQILGTFDRLERGFASKGFRGPEHLTLMVFNTPRGRKGPKFPCLMHRPRIRLPRLLRPTDRVGAGSGGWSRCCYCW